MLKKLYFGGKRSNRNLLSFLPEPFSELSYAPVKNESIPIFYFKSFLFVCPSGACFHIFHEFVERIFNEGSRSLVIHDV